VNTSILCFLNLDFVPNYVNLIGIADKLNLSDPLEIEYMESLRQVPQIGQIKLYIRLGSSIFMSH